MDEYPRRCIKNIEKWATQRDELTNNPNLRHELSREYASHIMAAMETNTPYKIGGNVLNTGLILNKEGYGTQHSLNRIFTKNLLSENGGAPV